MGILGESHVDSNMSSSEASQGFKYVIKALFKSGGLYHHSVQEEDHLQ